MWNLEKDELWFLIKCYNDYVQDFIIDRNLEDSLPVCLGEFYNNEYQEYYQYYLDLLWNDLSYVGVDEKDNITEDFYIWKSGTFRENIWHWFDERVERRNWQKIF
jgi:hypothetical protein